MNKFRLILFLSFFLPATLHAAGRGDATPPTPSVISLDGDWLLTGYSPDMPKHLELAAKVPGQVHVDLLREGIIEDPYWRDNAEKCQWVERWEWRYKKSFRLPEGFDPRWAKLQFDGLDTYADVYLNGRKIGEFGKPTADNMFQPYEFDINGWLKVGGENLLEVRFYPLERIIGERAKQKVYPVAFGDPIRSYVRRMQCTFGWDWVNRFVTMGIWRSCRITNYADARIDNSFFYTQSLNGNTATAIVEVNTTDRDNTPRRLNVRLTDPDNREVWSQSSSVCGSKLSRYELQLRSPQLWWPNGAGAHPVYTLTAELSDKNGIIHTKSYTCGIRTIAIEEIKEAPDASSFTILINNRRIFAKGGNWIPADPFPAQISAEKYRHLIGEAAAAGMNMLRVWGGGIFEAEPFWEACDRAGIMVWQDFLLACGGYPEDKEFVASFRREVESNVKLLRNHPSLIVWCGDNELSLNHKPDSDWPYKKIHTEVTAPLLATIDPSRPFRLSSPLGIDPKTTNSSISGDAHMGGQYTVEMDESVDAADYRLITGKTARARFLSESTTAGAPPKRSLLRFMNESDLANCEMFDYHTKDNPYVEGGLTLFGKLERLSQKLYGNPENNIDRRIRQLEYTQYDFVRQTMEATRANKFYTSGILFWMYNDCWPASGWSLIDYWGGRKAGWYAMASACRSVIAATQQIDDKLGWWVSSDEIDRDTKVNYLIKIQALNSPAYTTLKKGSITVKANQAVQLFEMAAEKAAKLVGSEKMAVLEITTDRNVTDRSYWTAEVPQAVKYPAAQLRIVPTGLGSTSGEVTVATDNWARVVTLDADADFEDNYFELQPGQSRTIKWHSAEPISQIGVSAWNSKQ